MRTWETTKTRHGTDSGHRLHLSLGERPCDPCYRAKQAYDERRRRSPERVVKDRLRAKAQMSAYQHLAHKYRDEYLEAYERYKKEYGV